MARVALPPGIYYVRNSDGKGIVSPSSDGSNFYIATANTSAMNQKFVINGVGAFTSMDTATHAFATTPSAVNAIVTRSATKTEWIINVKLNANNTFTGYIMTDDTKCNYWGLNGNNIQLQESSYDWTFTAV